MRDERRSHRLRASLPRGLRCRSSLPRARSVRDAMPESPQRSPSRWLTSAPQKIVPFEHWVRDRHYQAPGRVARRDRAVELSEQLGPILRR